MCWLISTFMLRTRPDGAVPLIIAGLYEMSLYTGVAIGYLIFH